MKTQPTPALILVAALLAASLTPAPAAPAGGVPSPGETEASVRELSEFHTVIFKLWHEAWPKKDMEMLASLLPDIEAGAARIQKATLPGILRDKQAAWDEGVGKLEETVSRYRAAVEGKDLQKSLDAGEALHAQFEALVRIVQPPLEELDAFHQVLYRLYHYELPDFSLEAVRTSTKELQEKMAALDKAALPARMQSKKVAFEARRKDLAGAVAGLAALAGSGKDEEAVKVAIETVHDRYTALADLF